ncbi:RICIN domain-containing protein [Kitasatospora sp. NPDC058184]|uniref:RICIN domain-containing protein n=1 Tax=Kitasatospora sp. NPDC058184 TaxID=3346370 RepID=UPI0036D91246
MKISKKIAVVTGISTMMLMGLMVPAGHADGRVISAFNAGVEQMLDSRGGSVAITYEADGSTPQKWALRDENSSGYLLESKDQPGNCLKAPTALNEPIAIVKCNNFVPLQRWKTVIEGDRALIARAGDTGEVIGANGASTEENRQPVTLQAKTSSDDQRWYITSS